MDRVEKTIREPTSNKKIYTEEEAKTLLKKSRLPVSYLLNVFYEHDVSSSKYYLKPDAHIVVTV